MLQGGNVLALVASKAKKLELREVADPTPSRDEAVVQVEAISLNRGEVRNLAKAEDGFRPGWDVAGTVLVPAQSGGPAAGTRVVGMVGHGAWAQKVAVPVKDLGELPSAVSFSAASTLPVAGLTALRTLARGGMLAGKRVLVTGASGGVGQFAVRLARLSGAYVAGVVSRLERADEVKALGAQEVIVGAHGTGAPFELILESVGGESLRQSIDRVSRGGDVVLFGNSLQQETTFNSSVLYTKHATLHGFILFADLERRGGGHDLSYLARLIERGELQPQIALEHSWKDALQAVRALEERKFTGKAVLRVD